MPETLEASVGIKRPERKSSRRIRGVAQRERNARERPWDHLYLNKGTRDEIHHLGHFYTLEPGLEVWNSIPGRRDSSPIGTTETGNLGFVLRDSNSKEPLGEVWTHVIVSLGEKDSEGNEKVRRFFDGYKDVVLSYMRWADIQKKTKQSV